MASGGTVPHKTDLQKVLECPLCLQQLENPKRLQPCYHSFCEECLKELIPASGEDDQNIKCPVCEISVTQTDISENTFLTDLISYVKSGDIPPEVKCKQCHGDPNMAVVKCVDCKIELCDSCEISHLKIPTLSDHTCVNLRDVSEKFVDKLHLCDSHSKPFEFNCRDCEDLLCAKCIDDHFAHYSESMKAAEENLIEQTNNMTKRMSKYCEILQQNVTGIRQRTDEVNKSFENANKVLEKQFERLIEQLTAIKEGVKQEVCQRREIVIKQLEDTKHRLECKLARGDHLQNVVSVTLQHARSSSLIKEMRNGLISTVKHFLDMKMEAPLHLSMPLSQIPVFEKTQQQESLQKFFCELKNTAMRLDITSYGPVVQSHTVTSYPEVLNTKLEHEFDIDDIEACLRLSYISGKIWLPQKEHVNIYNNDGTLERVLNTNKHVFSVKMAANGHIIFSGTTGLYYRRSETEDNIQITQESVYDVSCCGVMLAGYKHSTRTVEIYQLDESLVWNECSDKCEWKLKHSFQAKIENSSIADTLMLTENFVYLSLFNDKRVKKYTYNGRVVHDKHSVCPNMFCGCDKDDHFLLSVWGQKGKVKTTTANCAEVQSCILSEKVKYPFDVIVDSDLDVWVLQGHSPNFSWRLTKLSPVSRTSPKYID